MADLRLVLLGCLMLAAFAQGGSGDVLWSCLFTPKCAISSYKDVKQLGFDLRRANSGQFFKNGILKNFLDCWAVIQTTTKDGGCSNPKEVKNDYKDCTASCGFIKKMLAK